MTHKSAKLSAVMRVLQTTIANPFKDGNELFTNMVVLDWEMQQGGGL